MNQCIWCGVAYDAQSGSTNYSPYCSALCLRRAAFFNALATAATTVITAWGNLLREPPAERIH